MTSPNGGNLNFNRQPAGPSLGEPPAGSFGPGGFGTSMNSEALPESPAQFALRDRVPPSGLDQSQSAIVAPIGISTQAAGFTQNRGLPNQNQNPPSTNTRDLIAEMERASSRSAQDSPSSNRTPLTTAPTMQGFMATPAGETSLAEYERMTQLHNTEMNQIRQQIDAQRQLPGSENYFQNSPQSPRGTPNAADPNFSRSGFTRRSSSLPMPADNASRSMP